MNPLLLATDLDRTVIPNGSQPESPEARPMFRRLVEHDNVTLLYVSGRGRTLLMEAVEQYNLPLPLYAIGDVGSAIYKSADGSFDQLMEWQKEIAPDWQGMGWDDMRSCFESIDVLRLQEEEKQNDYKLSYYAPADTNKNDLIKKMQSFLPADINASFIWSIDEAENVGLMDVLPASATKLHAVQFMRTFLEIPEERMVYSGDSGNDLPAVTSGLNAVLVRNTRQEIQDEAKEVLESKGMADRLYVAKGDFLGLNGYYSAGVLEGVAHYFPETEEWMK